MSVQFFLISRKTSDSTEYCNDDPYEFILWWLVKYKTNQDTEVFVVNSGKNNFPKALMTEIGVEKFEKSTSPKLKEF